MTRTFKKIGKMVAVSAGIVLMGAIFSGCGFMKSTGLSMASTTIDGVASGLTNSTKSTSKKSSDTKTASKKSENANLSSDTSKEDNVKREKCDGDETKEYGKLVKGTCKDGIKEGIWKYYDNSGYIVLRESTYKNGILDGITKIYNKDETLSVETHYKDGIMKLSTFYAEMTNKDEFGDYGKKSDKIVEDYYDDGTDKMTRFYKNGVIVYLTYRQLQEKNIAVNKRYSIIDIFAKEKGLEQTYLPKLKAKYKKALNDAIKRDGTSNQFAMECASAVSEVENYNKGKTRIHPSTKTIKMAQECQNSPEYWAGSLNLVGAITGTDTTSTGKIQAQMQADYETYVISEMKKHSAKFAKDEDILAYIKNKQPIDEKIENTDLFIMTRFYKQDGIVTTFASSKYYIKGVFYGEFERKDIKGYVYHNRSAQNACVAYNDGNCRAFSRQFKELIDKSAFKDKIYNLLPKPKNQ